MPRINRGCYHQGLWPTQCVACAARVRGSLGWVVAGGEAHGGPGRGGACLRGDHDELGTHACEGGHSLWGWGGCAECDTTDLGVDYTVGPSTLGGRPVPAASDVGATLGGGGVGVDRMQPAIGTDEGDTWGSKGVWWESEKSEEAGCKDCVRRVREWWEEGARRDVNSLGRGTEGVEGN